MRVSAMSPSKAQKRNVRPQGVTRDAFLGGRLTILQPQQGPRAGSDAVMLAAAIPAQEGRGESLLEAGMGAGVVALALAHRIGDARVAGIEIQPDLVALARENVRLNDLESRVTVLQGDVTGPFSHFEDLRLSPASFDHVAANPPFHDAGRARPAQSVAKQRAHMLGEGELEQWIRFLAAMAAPHGTLSLIHRADALGTLLPLLERRFGGLIVFPLFPRRGEAATRIILQAVKGSRAPLRIARGLVLHEASGGFTPEAENILRHGRGLGLLHESSAQANGAGKKKAAATGGG